MQLPLCWEGDAHLVFFWTLASAVYCGDCKTFCPMSRVRPVTARPAPQWETSSKQGWGKNQQDVTKAEVYSLSKTQHVSGPIMPIFRSTRLLLHMVFCTCCSVRYCYKPGHCPCSLSEGCCKNWPCSLSEGCCKTTFKQWTRPVVATTFR
jgi:hypothetical protein